MTKPQARVASCNNTRRTEVWLICSVPQHYESMSTDMLQSSKTFQRILWEACCERSRRALRPLTAWLKTTSRLCCRCKPCGRLQAASCRRTKVMALLAFSTTSVTQSFNLVTRGCSCSLQSPVERDEVDGRQDGAQRWLWSAHASVWPAGTYKSNNIKFYCQTVQCSDVMLDESSRQIRGCTFISTSSHLDCYVGLTTWQSRFSFFLLLPAPVGRIVFLDGFRWIDLTKLGFIDAEQSRFLASNCVQMCTVVNAKKMDKQPESFEQNRNLSEIKYPGCALLDSQLLERQIFWSHNILVICIHAYRNWVTLKV